MNAVAKLKLDALADLAAKVQRLLTISDRALALANRLIAGLDAKKGDPAKEDFRHDDDEPPEDDEPSLAGFDTGHSVGHADRELDPCDEGEPDIYHL